MARIALVALLLGTALIVPTVFAGCTACIAHRGFNDDYNPYKTYGTIKSSGACKSKCNSDQNCDGYEWGTYSFGTGAHRGAYYWCDLYDSSFSGVMYPFTIPGKFQCAGYCK